MKIILVAIVFLLCGSLFAQQKYLTGVNPILVKNNSRPVFTTFEVHDTTDTYADTVIVELQNPITKNWEQIGCKLLDDFSNVTAAVPGDGKTKVYMIMVPYVTKNVRLRRTNVAHTDRLTRVTFMGF